MTPRASLTGGSRVGMGELGKVLASSPLQSSCEPSHILTKAQARFDLSTLEDLQKSLPLSIGVKSDTIYRTKMTLHSAKLFFKSQVEEPGRRKKSGAWLGTQSGFPQKSSAVVMTPPNTARSKTSGVLWVRTQPCQRKAPTSPQICQSWWRSWSHPWPLAHHQARPAKSRGHNTAGLRAPRAQQQAGKRSCTREQ